MPRFFHLFLCFFFVVLASCNCNTKTNFFAIHIAPTLTSIVKRHSHHSRLTLFAIIAKKKQIRKKPQKKRRTENKTNDRKNVVPPTKKTNNKAKQVYKSQHSFKLRYTLHTIPGSSSKFISINILCMQGCSNTYKLTYRIKATCPLGQKLRSSC